MPLTIPTGVAPAIAASQILQQVNGVLAQVSGAVNNGIPARGTNPAIAAADLQAAIGSTNLAKIEAAIVALS